MKLMDILETIGIMFLNDEALDVHRVGCDVDRTDVKMDWHWVTQTITSSGIYRYAIQIERLPLVIISLISARVSSPLTVMDERDAGGAMAPCRPGALNPPVSGL